MGTFSFKTADTSESIAINRPSKPVYLLQPGGKTPIVERNYQGYGVFGGVNAFEWLLEQNAQHLGIHTKNMIPELRRDMGIALFSGDVLQDTETGEYLHVQDDYRVLLEGKFFRGGCGDPIPYYGDKCANELVASGRLKVICLMDALNIPFPLKFSFDPKAVYESLPASTRCPYQGLPPKPQAPSAAAADGIPSPPWLSI